MNNETDELTLEAEKEILRKRDKVADALDRTGERLQRKGEQLGNGVANAAQRTAGAVESAGQFLRDFDGDELVTDMKSMVKRHPGRTLVGALLVGFFIGRTFRSNDS